MTLTTAGLFSSTDMLIIYFYGIGLPALKIKYG